MTQPSNAQDAVFEFLEDPKSHGGSKVQRIDTHAAAVFLAGDRAYKVKRAVRFPFLDYSTLEKRKAACDAELEVNRAFAGELYRRVVPITRERGGGLALAGDGEPVEWAVEMARFDENATLDHVAERRGIDEEVADQLAVTVAAMHRRAPKADADAWLAAIESYVSQNTTAFREHAALFEPSAVALLEGASRAALRKLHPLLVARGKLGLIRRGHGDLHLGNVALLDGRPVPFDAIEFDPVIASGDVLYDLAFLLMDLVERKLERAANIVLNRYFAATHRADDLDGLAGLPFFMSLRAAIRAKVTAARLQQADAAKRNDIEQAARTYFEFAVELLHPPPPQLIGIGGLSGTGKSALARSLAPFIAPHPGALVLRSDVERKALFEVGETERLPPDAYDPKVTARVYERLVEMAARAIAAGHSAIIDAVFAREGERAQIDATAKAAHVPFQGLFLVADLRTRLARVGARVGDASDADAAVAQKQEDYALGKMDWAEIDAGGTPDETLARARTAITPRAEKPGAA